MNKVTEEHIKSKIVDELYTVNGTLTVCIITVANGFKVIGTSACVDPANFNAETGRNLAYKNAFNQLWPLEGYLLAEKLYQDGLDEEGD